MPAWIEPMGAIEADMPLVLNSVPPIGPLAEIDGLRAAVAVLERLGVVERTRVMRYLIDRYGPSAAREAL